MKKLKDFAVMFFSGFANAFFGSGGGILAVSHFRTKGFAQKNSQASALAVTFFLSLFSCVYYYFKGFFMISDALMYIPFGIPGALCGSILLKKLPDKILKKLFAIFMIFSAVKILF